LFVKKTTIDSNEWTRFEQYSEPIFKY